MELLSIINFFGLIYLLYVVHTLQKKSSKQKQVPEISKTKNEQNLSDDVPVYQGNHEPDVLQKFFVWFARDWPLKVGALFMLLGFIWLVSYAFLNNWIGPVGRILFGILSGSAVLLWGSTRIKQNIYQGEILTGLGAGIMLVSISSAQYVYDQMFPPIAALALVTMVTVMVAFVSYRNNTVRLAILSYVTGAIAPVLTASSNPGVVGLFSYLFCLTVATIWLVRLTGWRVLLILSIFAVWLYSIPWLTTSVSPVNLVYMRFFAVTFTIMFYVLSLSSFAYDRKAKAEDAIAGSLIGLYALHWILTIVPPEYQSLLCVIFAVSFMSGSYAIFKLQKFEYPVYLYTGVSIVFLIAATMLQFKGNVLPMVLATEALVLAVFADIMYGPRMVKWMAALFIIPLLYSLPILLNFSSTSSSGTLLYINVTVYAAGFYFMKYSKINNEATRFLSKMLIVAAGIFSVIFLWVAMPYYLGYQNQYYYGFSSDSIYRQRLFMAHAITLTLYSLVGIGLYLYGMREKHLLTKRFGFWLTCFVIARLLLVEVWSMSLAARIVTFFIIGIIFIGSVFVRKSSHETQ